MHYFQLFKILPLKKSLLTNTFDDCNELVGQLDTHKASGGGQAQKL